MFSSEDTTMCSYGESCTVLDLSKQSTIAKIEQFPLGMEQNQIKPIDLTYVTKVEPGLSIGSTRNLYKIKQNLPFDLRSNCIKREPESSFQSTLPYDSDNSKESLETNITSGSTHSSDSADSIIKKTGAKRSVVRDQVYLERRRKNNQAAKKSRDAKRQREIQLKNQLLILQHQNAQMKHLLENCVCRSIAKANGGYIANPYNLGEIPTSFFL